MMTKPRWAPGKISCFSHDGSGLIFPKYVQMRFATFDHQSLPMNLERAIALKMGILLSNKDE